MLEVGIHRLTSIQGTVHFSIQCPGCEAPSRQFMVVLGIKSRQGHGKTWNRGRNRSSHGLAEATIRVMIQAGRLVVRTPAEL